MDPTRATAPTCAAEQLRLLWSEHSAAVAWEYPSDWYVPAVDAVCEAVVEHRDAWAAAERLGRDRAAAGTPLAETLSDVDALVDVAPDAPVETLRRAVPLGWADRLTAPPITVVDPLTGLVSSEYLQVRLLEIYAAAESGGYQVPATSAFVVVRLDLTRHHGLDRLLPMMLAADAMRSAHSAGETIAGVSDLVAVVLTPRTAGLPLQAVALAELLAHRLAADPTIDVGPPEVWIEGLPTGYDAAIDLLRELGR